MKTVLLSCFCLGLCLFTLQPITAEEIAEKPETAVQPTEKTQAYLGVYGNEGEIIPELLRQHLSLPEGGVIIGATVPDSSAQKAGLEAGDILVSFAGTLIQSLSQLREVVLSQKPGDKVEIEIIKKGQRQKLSVVLGSSPLKVIPGYEKLDSRELAYQLHLEYKKFLEGAKQSLPPLQQKQWHLELENVEPSLQELEKIFENLSHLQEDQDLQREVQSHETSNYFREETFADSEGSLTIRSTDQKTSFNFKDAAGKELLKDGDLEALKALSPAWAKKAEELLKNHPASSEESGENKEK